MRTYRNQFCLGWICKQELMQQCSFSFRGELHFDNSDNSQNSFLWPEYFIDFFMRKMDPMSVSDIRLVFTLPPRDSTLQYKRGVHLWNNFPCIITLDWQIQSTVYSLQSTVYSLQSTVYSLHSTVYSLHLQSTVYSLQPTIYTLGRSKEIRFMVKKIESSLQLKD